MGAAVKHISEFETDAWQTDHRSYLRLVPVSSPPGERDFYELQSFAPLKKRFLATHSLLPPVLSKFCEHEPNPWKFTRDERGRWHCESPRLGEVSSSAATHATAIATSTRGELDVDIEIASSVLDPLRPVATLPSLPLEREVDHV